MGQIIESRFRVMEFDEDDVLLSDIADTGLPVHVNKERDEYSGEVQNEIYDLEPGNVIEAEIQSESITQQDDTWKFIDLTVTDETRFHFIENADKHSSHVDELEQKLTEVDDNVIRTGLSLDDELIGYVSVGQDKGDQFWFGLRSGINTHEFDLQNLESIDNPPYEAIYTRTPDEKKLIFYHFAQQNTGAAEAILSANKKE